MTRAELRRQWNAAIHQGRSRRRSYERAAKDEPQPLSAATKKSFRRMKRLALALEQKVAHNSPAVELRGGAEEKPG